jgi:hypothetical protein
MTTHPRAPGRTGWSRAILMALGSLLPVCPAPAQETTGTLEGRVLDASGVPLEGARVTVAGPSAQGTREVSTSQEGRFTCLALPVGEYEVGVVHPTHATQTVKGVRIRLGRTTSLGSVHLRALLRREETVDVLGQPPLVDPASTFVGDELSHEEFAALPIERDYRNLATLLPQANESYLGDETNFAGSTGLENRYFIDGIDVTDPNRNSTGIRLPYNFVREVQVRTGGYRAEYRSSLGGVVNAVTHVGGNDVHGQVFGFFVNNQLSAKAQHAASEPSEGDFTRFDVGLGLGGPILRDRLWFYLAYSPAFEREDVEIPGQGFFQDRTTSHGYAGKVTWRAGPTHTLTLTAIGDPTNRRGVASPWGGYPEAVSFANPDPYLERIRAGGRSLMLEGQHVLRDGLLLQFFVSRAVHREENTPDSERGGSESLFIDSEAGLWSGGAPDNVDNRSVVTTAGLGGTFATARHLLKGGLEYRNNRWDFGMAGYYLQRYSDDYYFEWVMEAQGRVANRTLSAFVQDSWRPADRLRIDVGLRWDGQYIVSSEGKVAQRILDQWQPRIGFTWRPPGTADQKVSGSLGRFYQELPTFPLFFYYNAGNRYDFVSYDHDPRVDPTGADRISTPGEIQPEILGMRGQHFDEISLGYERRIGKSTRIGLRGIYRTLRQGLEDGWDPEEGIQFNNPGSGALSDFPRVKRNYGAIELTVRRRAGERLTTLGSYVLSRATGNYTGLFHSDFGTPWPNVTGAFDLLETLDNGDGLLPNDRTHVLKLAGAYQLGAGLQAGVVGLWETGTPLNEFGGAEFGAPFWTFLQPRGTAGRTPSIWDLSLRIAYQLPTSSRLRPRLTLDVLHIASRRAPVNFDQTHYFNVDGEGNQIDPNPTYGLPTRFQPPMALRLGVELAF